MQLVNLQISCECTPGYQAKKGLHTGTIKIDPYNASISNSHITIIYLTFIKNTYFNLYWKTEKLKINVLAFFKQENLQ